MINIALPKGRMGKISYELLERAGYGSSEFIKKGRKLIFTSDTEIARFFWVKPSDVAIYVERGVADIGFCGKDVILETAPQIYEILDLNIGLCSFCVAGKKDFRMPQNRPLSVATKFPKIALMYFEKLGREIDLVKLNGSIEIAPLLGLSDVIVDIVETGNTLRENDLVVLEEIEKISTILISNKISYRFKYDEIIRIREEIGKINENL